jgi:hypothetical protein
MSSVADVASRFHQAPSASTTVNLHLKVSSYPRIRA